MKKPITVLFLVLCLTACINASETAPTNIPDPTLAAPNTVMPTALPPTPTRRPSPTPTTPLPAFPTLEVEFNELISQEAGLLPEFRQDVSGLEGSTRYWIDVQVEFDSENKVATIDGMVRMKYTNPLDDPLDEIVFTLWPNHQQYQAEMTVGQPLINNILVEAELGEENLFLKAPLSPELPPGGIIDVSIPFNVLASGTIGEIGLKRFGISYSIFAAPTFYPLIPRLIEGEWQKDPGSEAGDPTNSEVAFYEVTITAPIELDLITSGVEVASIPPAGEYQTKTFVTGPMRDFAFVLGPFEKIERTVDGVDLNGWVLRGHLEDGETMMDAASQQFSLLSNLVGPYPYPELDLVDVPGGFGGIEYPGLVFIGTLGDFDIIDPTVHEVAHQWFYGLIGNDQLNEPWIDEAISSYWQILYYENTVSPRGSFTPSGLRYSSIWREVDPNQPIGLGVGDYDSSQDYVAIVYWKGAIFFDQFRSTLGEETFLEFLSTYYRKYRYGFATSEGFQATAEEVCACDLDELFRIWVIEGGEMPLPEG
jgi:hypothetical protein